MGAYHFTVPGNKIFPLEVSRAFVTNVGGSWSDLYKFNPLAPVRKLTLDNQRLYFSIAGLMGGVSDMEGLLYLNGSLLTGVNFTGTNASGEYILEGYVTRQNSALADVVFKFFCNGVMQTTCNAAQSGQGLAVDFNLPLDLVWMVLSASSGKIDKKFAAVDLLNF